jgi:hypothetical protein
VRQQFDLSPDEIHHGALLISSHPRPVREALEVVDRLRRRHIIATTMPYATSYARLTPSIYNTPEEIETTLRESRTLG